MNTVLDESCHCSKAELDLFTTPPINISMERGYYAIHHPISTLSSSGPLEFHVEGSPEDYIDLGRTKLHIKVKVTEESGANIAEGAKVSTVNLLLHSLFSQVDCKLNEKLVTPSVNTYPYKAYIETLLSHGTESKNSWLEAELYHKDEPPMDSYDPSDEDANPGLIARQNKIEQSKIVELIGRPHVDIFQQDRYLLNGVSMDLRFIRSSKDFFLMSPEIQKFKTQIIHASLHVRKVRLNPTISLQHASALDQDITAKYPMRRGVVTSFAVSAGNLSFNKENLISGQLPRRIILGFVSNTAFNGSAKHNPFYFQNYGLNFLTLTVGSQQFPSQPLTPNFSTGECVSAFNQLYQAVGMHNSRHGIDIDLASFMQGNTLYAFDLTTDMSEGAHIDPIKYGSIRAECHFASALPHAINVIVYAEYDSMIQVDKTRNILADFAPS